MKQYFFKLLLSLLLIPSGFFLQAQVGGIEFLVVDDLVQPIDSFQVFVIKKDSIYTNQAPGVLVIDSLEAGIYSFELSAKGFEKFTLFEKEIKQNQIQSVEIDLIPAIIEVMDDTAVLKIRKQTYAKTAESPLSLRNLVAEEISRSPGANRDISKALQALPGVTSVSSFRNDLLIRGGGPNENRFFIDKVETPIINHFATQGAGGGPRGIINVDFIGEVDFYSSAFPANRGNALSSVLDFKYRKAAKGPINVRGVAGLDDYILMADGQSNKGDWEYLVSARQSNLGLLFGLLDIPILPKYKDFQGKVRKKFSNGDELYVIGIGSIDEFNINFDVERTDENLSAIDASPQEAPQRSYTFGLVYEKQIKRSKLNFIVSRDYLSNGALKHKGNTNNPLDLLFDYNSTESNNRLRVEYEYKLGNWNLYSGLGAEQANYTNDSYLKRVFGNKIIEDESSTEINFGKYFLFTNADTRLFNNKLRLSMGVRTDFSDYATNLQNPIEQISPRMAASLKLTNKLNFNFATGLYYQLPPFTVLGFQFKDEFLNKEAATYTQNFHLAGGLEYQTESNAKISLEGYYKKYNNYPFSIRSGVNLANLGSDFGVLGVEPIAYTGEGETYGMEFLAQQRLSTKMYGLVSYTLGWSRFNNSAGDFIPSAWDARHILNMTVGRNFKKNWNIGTRFRLQSALPQTPFDLNQSALVNTWDVNQFAVQDFSRLNSQRGVLAHQMDLRIEKKKYYKNFTLGFYADIVNLYGGPTADERDFYLLKRDAAGEPIIANPGDPQDQQRYEIELFKPEANTPIPFIGLIFEF